MRIVALEEHLSFPTVPGHAPSSALPARPIAGNDDMPAVVRNVAGRIVEVGKDRIAVPGAFWKVVIDPNQHAALAFLMPQRALKKGDLRPWLVSIDTVDQAAGFVLPLPPGIDTTSVPKLWPASLTGWREEHKRSCG